MFETSRPAWILVALIFTCILGLAQMSAQVRDEQRTITVRGTLERVAGIGGETTGWAVRLDSETEIGGKRWKSIEVTGNRADFVKLEDKHVEAAGNLAVRHGVERGEWTVLEVTSIRALDSSR